MSLAVLPVRRAAATVPALLETTRRRRWALDARQAKRRHQFALSGLLRLRTLVLGRQCFGLTEHILPKALGLAPVRSRGVLPLNFTNLCPVRVLASFFFFFFF